MKISVGQWWQHRQRPNYPARLVIGVDRDGQMVTFSGGQRTSRVSIHRVWRDYVQVDEVTK